MSPINEIKDLIKHEDNDIKSVPLRIDEKILPLPCSASNDRTPPRLLWRGNGVDGRVIKQGRFIQIPVSLKEKNKHLA